MADRSVVVQFRLACYWGHYWCNNVTDSTDRSILLIYVLQTASLLSINCVWHSRRWHANKIHLRYYMHATSALTLIRVTSTQTTATFIVSQPISTFTKNEKHEVMRFVWRRFLSALTHLTETVCDFLRTFTKHTHTSDKTTLHKKLNDSFVAFAEISSHLIKYFLCFFFRLFDVYHTNEVKNFLISEYKAPHKHQQQHNAASFFYFSVSESVSCLFVYCHVQS